MVRERRSRSEVKGIERATRATCESSEASLAAVNDTVEKQNVMSVMMRSKPRSTQNVNLEGYND